MKDRELIAHAAIWNDGALLVNGNTNKKTGEKYVAIRPSRIYSPRLGI